VYCENERRPPGIALLVGSGVHVGAERAMKTKAETHANARAEDVRDMAVAGFDDRMHKEDVLFTKDERSQGRELVVGKTRDRVAAMAHYWACVAQPEYQPDAPEDVEHQWSIQLPKTGTVLVGVTDLIIRGTDQVVDWKTTGGRRIAQREVDTSVALSAYALAYLREHGREVNAVKLDVIQEGKQTKRYMLQSTRNRIDYENLLNRISTMMAAVRAGNFVPCNPGEWFCDPKWCGFYENGCRYVNSERLATGE